MSLKEEENQLTNKDQLINNEADVMNFLESLESKPLIKADIDESAAAGNTDASADSENMQISAEQPETFLAQPEIEAEKPSEPEAFKQPVAESPDYPIETPASFIPAANVVDESIQVSTKQPETFLAQSEIEAEKPSEPEAFKQPVAESPDYPIETPASFIPAANVVDESIQVSTKQPETFLAQSEIEAEKPSEPKVFNQPVAESPDLPVEMPTPFDMQQIDENVMVATYEEAVRKIVFLEDKLKRKEGEILESQKLIESVLAENRDKIELLEQAEIKVKNYESEIDRLNKSSLHEHEKRRLHLFHVRDLKHAIAERDARIKRLETSAGAIQPVPQVYSTPDMPSLTRAAVVPHSADYSQEPQFVENEEIKKLQSDIFYKEIEIEKLNASLLAAQRESLLLKAQQDELRSEIDSLKLEISYKESSIDELKSSIESMEAEIKELNEKYFTLSELNVSAEDIEKMKLASDVKEFLEDELDRLAAGDETKDETKAGEESGPDAPEGPEASADEAVKEPSQEPEGKKQLGELDEIKEKFKSLIAERDKAIELLDKFEAESRLNERELNELKLKYASLSGEYETSENNLKEKETELQGIYTAFSSYKEESGFMSRENKILKEERDALNAEILKLRESVNEFELAVADKDGEIKRIAIETEEKLKAALEENENRIRALAEEKEEAIQRIKIDCEAETETHKAEAGERLRDAEKCRAELEAFKAEFAGLEAKYQSALADYQGIKLNTENLLANITETLNLNTGADQREIVEPNVQVANELLLVCEETDSETDNFSKAFERFAQNYELKITKMEYSSLAGENSAAVGINPLLCVFMVGGEKDLIKVFDIKANQPSPLVVCSRSGISVNKITELISRGVIDDYLEQSMDDFTIDSVMTRVVEGRLAKIQKISVKKDCEEIKLRESVALTIDNKVKAGRIENLNERIEYLKDSNRKMKASISEMQKLFDRIIACITALSLQEIPQNISEGFNEITGILLKITSIKL